MQHISEPRMRRNGMEGVSSRLTGSSQIILDDRLRRCARSLQVESYADNDKESVGYRHTLRNLRMPPAQSSLQSSIHTSYIAHARKMMDSRISGSLRARWSERSDSSRRKEWLQEYTFMVTVRRSALSLSRLTSGVQHFI